MALRAQLPSLADLQEVAWLKSRFDLTPDHVEALLAIENEYHEQVMTLCERHCAARNKLAEQFLRRDWTKDAEQIYLREMGEAQVKTDAATMEHFRRVRAVLTPAQREQYEQMVAARMYASCPHRLHHGALTKHDLSH